MLWQMFFLGQRKCQEMVFIESHGDLSLLRNSISLELSTRNWTSLLKRFPRTGFKNLFRAPVLTLGNACLFSKCLANRSPFPLQFPIRMGPSMIFGLRIGTNLIRFIWTSILIDPVYFQEVEDSLTWSST